MRQAATASGPTGPGEVSAGLRPALVDANGSAIRPPRCWAQLKSPSMAACSGGSGASTVATTITTGQPRATGRRIARRRRRTAWAGTTWRRIDSDPGATGGYGRRSVRTERSRLAALPPNRSDSGDAAQQHNAHPCGGGEGDGACACTFFWANGGHVGDVSSEQCSKAHSGERSHLTCHRRHYRHGWPNLPASGLICPDRRSRCWGNTRWAWSWPRAAA